MDIQIIQLVYTVIILAISIGLHEYAHAISSYSLGDPTPKLQGRLTPNPIAHIDPIGFLMIFIIHFGWGKPVQVNPMYYKRPLRDELLVALAGPFTNLMLAVLALIMNAIYYKYVFNPSNTNIDLILLFWSWFASINIALAVFNMIPIPPLDGFRIVKFLAPKIGRTIEQYSLHISIAFLLFIVLENSLKLNIIGGFITSVSNFISNIISAILNLIFF